MEKRTDIKSGLIKVAVVGAESTGKTSLAFALANYYDTAMVIEYARPYLEDLDYPYTQEDVETIAKEQITEEDLLAHSTRRLLICDTNLLVIKIWMDHAYGTTPDWILNEIKTRQYDLHILTDFDIPYEADALREHPEMRDYFTGLYQQELESRGLKYIKVSGSENARLAQAVTVIDDLMKLK